MLRFSATDMPIGSSVIDEAGLSALLQNPAGLALLDALPDGIILADPSGTVVFSNTAAETINGIRREQITGLSLGALAKRSSIDWTAMTDAFHDRKRKDCLTLGQNRQSVLTSVRFVRDAEHQPCFTVFVHRDLELLDHQRHVADGPSANGVFKFAADAETTPDFATQSVLSPTIGGLLENGCRAIRNGARILLIGESGTGKTELAKHFHQVTQSKTAPFIHVNCGSIPENLFESEMFGYERGAFTGAVSSGKKGLIQAARGGVLFLDEVGEIPPLSQAKLLRFLEDGMVQKIGSHTSQHIETCVIAATNRDLLEMVDTGRFRRDLFYRLSVITLEVPPLRDQPQLINHLIDYFATRCSRARKRQMGVNEACRAALNSYGYPGNIRELSNIVQGLAVMADQVADASHLPPHIADGAGTATTPSGVRALKPTSPPQAWSPEGEETLKELVKGYEGQIIDAAISRHGSKRKAAKALGVDIGTIVRKTQQRQEQATTKE